MIKPKSKAILQRQIDARERLWPEVRPEMLWNRTERDGFVTMPRTMPLIMRIMDYMSGKGVPVSAVYLDLWCRTFDEGFLQLNRPEEMAFYSGFSGQRAVRTWKDRMKRLHDLKFIDLKSGPLGDYSFALIWNPYHTIARGFSAGSVTEDMWQALLFRASEIGAKDFDDLDDDGKIIEKKKEVEGSADAKKLAIPPMPS